MNTRLIIFCQPFGTTLAGRLSLLFLLPFPPFSRVITQLLLPSSPRRQYRFSSTSIYSIAAEIFFASRSAGGQKQLSLYSYNKGFVSINHRLKVQFTLFRHIFQRVPLPIRLAMLMIAVGGSDRQTDAVWLTVCRLRKPFLPPNGGSFLFFVPATDVLYSQCLCMHAITELESQVPPSHSITCRGSNKINPITWPMHAIDRTERKNSADF